MYSGETPVRYLGRQDWAEGEFDLHFRGDGASVDSAGSSGAGLALQSCPMLQHGNQTFISFHKPSLAIVGLLGGGRHPG